MAAQPQQPNPIYPKNPGSEEAHPVDGSLKDSAGADMGLPDKGVGQQRKACPLGMEGAPEAGAPRIRLPS
jgi:hypothetical protein